MPANHLITHKDQEYAVCDLQVQVQTALKLDYDENDRDPNSKSPPCSISAVCPLLPRIRKDARTKSSSRSKIAYGVTKVPFSSSGLRRQGCRSRWRQVSCSCAFLQVARFVWSLGLVTWMPWATGEVRRAVCWIATCTCIELFLPGCWTVRVVASIVEAVQLIVFTPTAQLRVVPGTSTACSGSCMLSSVVDFSTDRRIMSELPKFNTKLPGRIEHARDLQLRRTWTSYRRATRQSGCAVQSW
ncbi:hypothetical protein BDV19DRAFT_244369 [Aspergillus venezuelensis]